MNHHEINLTGEVPQKVTDHIDKALTDKDEYVRDNAGNHPKATRQQKFKSY